MTESLEDTAYDRLGGDPVLRALVNRFYRNMDELPECVGLRRMHAPDLQGAEDKLFKFLSGWLGGPNLYWQEFGHPRLRMRHLPFSIGAAERDQWLTCMRMALDSEISDEDLRQRLFAAFVQTANHMMNRAE